MFEVRDMLSFTLEGFSHSQCNVKIYFFSCKELGFEVID